MSSIKLCKNDNLLSLLKDTFKANPITVPEERIKPLIVLSNTKKKNKYIGSIENLLVDGSPIDIEIQNSQMANLSATNSKSVKTELGLQIMDGFLKGLGSKGVTIKSAFEGVEKISFSFQNVIRSYVDVGRLIRILSERKFNITNAINTQFVEESSKCIIIDSIITSNNFSIKVEKSSKKDFKFDIPEIKKIVSSKKNNISVSTKNNLEISFQGEKSLAFAFSCFALSVNDDGSIYYDGEPDKMYLTIVPDKVVQLPANLILEGSNYGLMELEFDN